MNIIDEKRRIRIGVDLMGNENDPLELLNTLQNENFPPEIELVAIGPAQLKAHSKMNYLLAEDHIKMDEPPLLALRRKKGASMIVGMRALKANAIDALISAGNTGALISSAKFILKTKPDVLRPALLTKIPTQNHSTIVLDVGANIRVHAEHLVQFAHLGADFCKKLGIQSPKVGLLNIGHEPIKGPSELQIAYQRLEKTSPSIFQFVGNVEGKSVFDAGIDVLVTDGFTGNIFLKTAEGMANFILNQMGPDQTLQKRLHYAEYPGAVLAGVQGVVIKCHGYAPPKAFIQAIMGAKAILNREKNEEIFQ